MSSPATATVTCTAPTSWRSRRCRQQRQILLNRPPRYQGAARGIRWTQRHGPQLQGGRGVVEGAERHGLPEDARAYDFLGRRDYERPDGQHPDDRRSNRGRPCAARSRCSPARAGVGPSVARHAVDFWLTTEDLPRSDNRSPPTVTATSTWRTPRPLTRRPPLARGAEEDPERHRDGRAPRPAQELLHGHEHPGCGLRPPGRDLPVRHRPGHLGARRATARRTSWTTWTLVDTSFFQNMARNPDRDGERDPSASTSPGGSRPEPRQTAWSPSGTRCTDTPPTTWPLHRTGLGGTPRRPNHRRHDHQAPTSPSGWSRTRGAGRRADRDPGRQMYAGHRHRGDGPFPPPAAGHIRPRPTAAQQRTTVPGLAETAVTLTLAGKKPGAGWEPQMEELTFAQRPGSDQRPYDRVIGAALDGERWQVARQETVEAAWKILGRCRRRGAGPPLRQGQLRDRQRRIACSPTATTGATRPSDEPRDDEDRTIRRLESRSSVIVAFVSWPGCAGRRGHVVFRSFVDHVPAAAQAARTARVSCGVPAQGMDRETAAMITRRSLMVMSS